MATSKNLTDLVINKVENQEVFNHMQANGLIHEDELYLIGGDSFAVLYTSQELTEEQKAQVRLNIGAISAKEQTQVQIITWEADD